MRRSRVLLGPTMVVDGHRLGRVTFTSNIGTQVECTSHGNLTRFAVLSDAPTRFKPGDGSEWLFSPSFYHQETNRDDSRARTVVSVHLRSTTLRSETCAGGFPIS
jgi:hypothetical protein